MLPKRWKALICFVARSVRSLSLSTTTMEVATEVDEVPLRIPVRNSAEVVEIRPSELPYDANDILDVLRAEAAPLATWLQIAVRVARCRLVPSRARSRGVPVPETCMCVGMRVCLRHNHARTYTYAQVEYHNQNNNDAFLAILTEASHPDLEQLSFYKDSKNERIAILNALAAFYVKRARDEKGTASAPELVYPSIKRDIVRLIDCDNVRELTHSLTLALTLSRSMARVPLAHR